MTTYNTAYKSGTFNGSPSSGSTTSNVSGFTPVAGDVGRILVITTGNGRLQHREITGVSGQNITIAHAWDTNPFIDTSSDSRATDVLPSSGDTVVVSYDGDDLIVGDADLTLTGTNNLAIAGIILATGAYVHFKNYNILWNYQNTKIGEGAGLILGYYGYVAGRDGYVKNSCNITDTATTSGGGIHTSDSNFGMMDIYGGNLYAPSGTPFWRAYGPAGSSREFQNRWVDFTTYGNFGSRTGGDRSLLVNCVAIDAQTTLGFSNPRGSVARVEISALNSNQAGYVWLSTSAGGPSGRLVFPRLVDIKDKVIRCNASSHSGINVMEVVAKKSEIDNAPTFIEVSATPSGTHTFRFGNLLRPTIIDDSGSLVTDSIKNRLYDATSTFIEQKTIADGKYPEVFIRHTDVPTVSGDQNLSDGTQYAPYSLRSVSYGKLFTTTNINAEDVFESAIGALNDLVITESTKATVDAYTTLETSAKFYDRAVSWLEGNITNETAFLVTRSGSTIDAGSYNVTIDATAGSTFAFDGSTITIKASTFTGSITTTGTFTLANGATFIGSVTDVSGTSSSTPFEITGLVSGNIYIQDDTGTLFDYQTGVTGTYNAVAPLGSSGTWKVTVDSAGYIANKFTFIADGAGKNFSGILTQLTQPSGSPMYTGSSSALLSVAPVADGSKMLVRIGNGFVTAQEVFDEVEDALATTVGMEYLSNGGGRIELAVLPTGTFLFLKTNITDGIQMIRDSAPDASATVGAFISSTDGTVVDGSNGEIQFISSTGITAAAVKAEVDQALVDYDVDTKTNVKPSVSV
tara:strand:+ start:3556 stop:5958 length:2403 start_codon:yes stop_codon:yes gene_type:complete